MIYKGTVSVISRDNDGITEQQCPCIIKKSDSVEIRYKDDDAQYFINIFDNTVIMHRTISVGRTVMQFTKSKEYDFMYKTPYGSIPMKIFTENIIFSEQENVINLNLEYKLTAGGETLLRILTLTAERNM